MKQRNLLLIGIFFIALFLRMYHLGILPKTFYVEELTNTYVGKFILLHGKDITGHTWPILYFDKFGDYPPVLPIYLSGISSLLLGTNEFAGRLPIAVAGALLVFAVFELAHVLFRNEKASVFAAFATAVMPWHIVLSRTTAEGVVGLTVWAWGIVWVIGGIGEKKSVLIWRSFAFFFLSYFLYPSLRILVPLTLLPLPYLTWRTDKKLTKLLCAGFVVFALLTGYIATTPWGRARFNQTSLFASPEIRTSIAVRNKQLSDGLGPNQVFRARIFHNKVTGYVREFANQYLSYFSPKFLFLEGGMGQYRYFNVPDQGLLFIAFLPFLLAAFIPAKGTRRSLLTYIVYLLVITPIPAALTVDFAPHAHRSMFMILPLVLLMAGGFAALWQGGILKKLVVFISLGFLLVEFIYFWNQYDQANGFQSMLRNDGDREVAVYIKNERTKYAHIYAPVYERLPLYYLFYSNNFSPSLTGRFEAELELPSVDNISFVKSWCPTKLSEVQTAAKNILVIERADCENMTGFQIIKTISRMDGTTAYRILKRE